MASEKQTWFSATNSKGIAVNFAIKRTIFKGNTASKNNFIEIYDTTNFGKIIVLNKNIRSVEFDAQIFSEMFINLPLCAHSSPSKVLIFCDEDTAGILQQLLTTHKFRTHHIYISLHDKEVEEIIRDNTKNALHLFTNDKVVLNLNDPMLENCFIKDIDIICINNLNALEKLCAETDLKFLKHIYSYMDGKGILCIYNRSLWYDLTVTKNIYDKCKKLFPNVAVAIVPTPVQAGGNMTFILASRDKDITFKESCYKITHCEMSYYNDQNRWAAFSLPECFKKYFQ